MIKSLLEHTLLVFTTPLEIILRGPWMKYESMIEHYLPVRFRP